jgi:hypothetical protein
MVFARLAASRSDAGRSRSEFEVRESNLDPLAASRAIFARFVLDSATFGSTPPDLPARVRIAFVQYAFAALAE